MRVFLVAVLVALVAYVSGQGHCDEHHHCHDHGHMHCGGHNNVACHEGVCECTDGGATDQTCTMPDDCTCPTEAPDHHHPGPAHDAHPHCIDGKCHCTRGPPPPGH